MAAGASRRFGPKDKRLARLPSGRTLLAATLIMASAAFARVRVVLRDDDDPVALGLPADAPILRAPRAAAGLGASLADAFTALGTDPSLSRAQAAAVLLGDMPGIAPDTLVRLCDAAAPERIVRPLHAGRPGHPVLFGRDVWAELADLDGDEGARRVVARHRARCHELEIDDPGIHLDIDVADDLATLWRGDGV
nr:NTP transferase domain-containing protein [Halomonas getboli]